MSGLAAAAGQLFVISGCSGSGKSTLIAALAESGEAVAREPGREVVKLELERGGDGFPWANKQRFIDLCAEWAVRDYDHHAGSGRRAFFDRGFVDVASAVALTGLVAPPVLEEALGSRRYAPLVFISPPWEALFRPDAERRHAFADAVAEYEMLVPTYRKFGYEVAFLPPAPVRERVEFVLAAAGSVR